ncbi:MAG: methyltransferase domain-containing protein [Pseudomonadota bacterium]
MNDLTFPKGFDAERAEAFAGQLVGTITNAATSIMISLGHRVGLFDAMAALPPSRSEALASSAGLAERYVREWLAVMVTSRIVEYQAEAQTYSLPAEHAAFLTRAAAPNNIAVTSQFVGVAASVEEQMIERFQSGDGLHYDHFLRFHEVMAEDSDQTTVMSLIDHILPIVPGLVERLKDGIDVVDVACGGGRVLLKMAEAFPNSSFTGLDLCEDAFAEARVRALKDGLDNLVFKPLDLSTVTALGAFDLVTGFDAVHDQKDPLGLVKTVYNSLNDGGVFLMQDIGGSRDLATNMDNPFAPLLFTISLMHCTPMSIGQGGPGLGTMWGVETAQEFLAEAGFADVQAHRLPHDPVNAYFVARR